MALTRRNFLVGAASTAGIAAAGLDARAETNGASASAQHAEYATLLDIEKCIGCGQCVEGCRERNGNRYPEVKKPLPVMFPPGTKDEDWSGKRDVDDRLTPYNWLYIESVTVQKDGAPLELHIPRRCLHCTNPPCANLCPWGAASRQPETGTVSIDSQTCLGAARSAPGTSRSGNRAWGCILTSCRALPATASCTSATAAQTALPTANCPPV